MVKKLLLLSLVLIGTLAEAVLVKLPVTEVLEQRVSQVVGPYFVKNTTLVQELASQEMEASGVFQLVDLALYDYEKYFRGDPRLVMIMQTSKPLIVRSILKDCPEAIQELKDMGLIK